jgi:predicted Zn-ribbon and HTH transcriptional regulator
MEQQQGMDARVETIARMATQGATLRDAGAVVGVSASQACRLLLPLGDAIDRRRRRTLTSMERIQIVRISDLGEDSTRAIARRVRRSWHSVRKVLDRQRKVRFVQPHRCEVCGARIHTNLCVACVATGRIREGG